MILDRPLYLWNKDNNNKKHLYFEVDSSDDGWGGCAYQYAIDHPNVQCVVIPIAIVLPYYSK